MGRHRTSRTRRSQYGNPLKQQKFNSNDNKKTTKNNKSKQNRRSNKKNDNNGNARKKNRFNALSAAQRKRSQLSTVKMKQQKVINGQRKKQFKLSKQPKNLEYLRKIKSGDSRQLKGFASKLSILKVSIHRRKENNEFDSTFRDSYFASKVHHIIRYNKSLEIGQLQLKLGKLAASLPHVLLHKREIFNILIEFISDKKNKHVISDGMNLLVELAKDIKKEFYPMLGELMAFLVEMLEWRETQLANLETVFTAFSWLFKFLQKYITINDFIRFFNNYFFKILSNRHYYIRDYMAEILGYMVRVSILNDNSAIYSTNDSQNMINVSICDKSAPVAVGKADLTFFLLKNVFLSIKTRDRLFKNCNVTDSNRNREAIIIGLSVFLFQTCRVELSLHNHPCTK